MSDLEHKLTRADVDTLRTQLHAQLDSVLDRIEFDEEGHLVSEVYVKVEKAAYPLAFSYECQGHVVTSTTLTCTVEETEASIRRQTEELRADFLASSNTNTEGA
jgi:hypothetical protein